jgi:hypothetical protein
MLKTEEYLNDHQPYDALMLLETVRDNSGFQGLLQPEKAAVLYCRWQLGTDKQL